MLFNPNHLAGSKRWGTYLEGLVRFFFGFVRRSEHEHVDGGHRIFVLDVGDIVHGGGSDEWSFVHVQRDGDECAG